MRIVVSVILLLLSLNLMAQDFFRADFDRSKNYILLANPTAVNVETIKFLSEKNLLKVNPQKTHFVGVYHKDQRYNFEETLRYIQQKELPNFHLHEIRNPINDKRLFEQNELSDELKLIFSHSIGIIFFGGPDIPPSVYGEENTLSVVTDPQRHYFETTFLFHLLGGFQDEEFVPFLSGQPEYLVTGFCLGLQTMNVATGGTLIQDIPAEVYDATTPEETIQTGKENLHRNYWQKISNDPKLAGINFHTIRFSEHPFFGETIKMRKNATPLVYSSHHQAVEKMGKGLEVTAYSSDGKVIEGLAHSHYPHVFSVQFHPEVPSLFENREKYKIFPDDSPKTFHQMLDRKSSKFHKKYWNHISKIINKVSE